MNKFDREGPVHRSCVQYLRTVLPGAIIHHSPNEGVRGGKSGMLDGAKRKAMGQVAGYPDIIVHYRGWTMGFEVKAEGGRMEPSQTAMQAQFSEQGIPYAVVRSIEDVREALADWQVPNTERDNWKSIGSLASDMVKGKVS